VLGGDNDSDNDKLEVIGAKIDAEGVEVQWYGDGVSPSQAIRPLGVLEERPKFPSGVRGKRTKHIQKRNQKHRDRNLNFCHVHAPSPLFFSVLFPFLPLC